MTQANDPHPVDSGEPLAFIHHPTEALIRKELARFGVVAVRIVGPPGSGKTLLIQTTIRRLPAPRRVAVIVVNPAAGRDAQRLRPFCGNVQFIDAPVPRSSAIWQAIQQIQLDNTDLLLIETCGGLARMADLGQDATVAVFAVSGGDDKAAEYAGLLSACSAAVITKTDLLPHVQFNMPAFRRDLERLNPAARVFEVSAVTDSGLPEWQHWLLAARPGKRPPRPSAETEIPPGEQFLG